MNWTWVDLNSTLEYFVTSYLPPHIQGYPRKCPVNIWAEVSYMYMSRTGDVNAFYRYLEFLISKSMYIILKV